ncbi:MAG TPA: hypothetical protein VIZ18_10050 [Ktedonobacteraceae bacterium]
MVPPNFRIANAKAGPHNFSLDECALMTVTWSGRISSGRDRSRSYRDRLARGTGTPCWLVRFQPLAHPL